MHKMSKRDIAGYIAFAIILVFLVFGILFLGSGQHHPFGNPDETDMDQYIIDNSQVETGANNAVTAVVFDYRGFDTLGEATILFTAVAGVVLLFRRLKK